MTAQEVHVSPPPDRHVSDLVNDMTEQITRLVKDEVALAAQELRVKAKRGGIAAGLGGVAAACAFIGAIALAAAAVLGLSYVLPAWLSALVVAAALFVAASVAALVLKAQVDKARPLVPERTIDSLRDDVAALKGNS
jgi:fatty acid desaturase